ncbi:myricetin O-methyltransferase-like [Coffea eugenioides]|uniref:myricetin O-methyltransferase-like n=1 Tax=Coffea eugenioides TaxID=49369 RepID=UPI000F605DD1|nr:myricetin O-methyltransferase-like [Coffea eugenioides]XP_027172176.1 myricetin O-methyltransferase-like [Coffea eugenioides]
MASDNHLSVEVLMTKCKSVFEGLTTLADVGGGTGKVARAIAQNFPNIKCTVYDLPHVVANQGGAENLEFLAGDMFQSVPRANAILLKRILHDWSDEDRLKILKNCKKAIPEKENGGKEELNPLFSMAQEETMRLALVHSDFIQKLVMLFNIGQHLVYGRQIHFSR